MRFAFSRRRGHLPRNEAAARLPRFTSVPRSSAHDRTRRKSGYDVFQMTRKSLESLSRIFGPFAKQLQAYQGVIKKPAVLPLDDPPPKSQGSCGFPVVSCKAREWFAIAAEGRAVIARKPFPVYPRHPAGSPQGAGAFRIRRLETCVHQASASPDTPSEFTPFPANLTPDVGERRRRP